MLRGRPPRRVTVRVRRRRAARRLPGLLAPAPPGAPAARPGGGGGGARGPRGRRGGGGRAAARAFLAAADAHPLSAWPGLAEAAERILGHRRITVHGDYDV